MIVVCSSFAELIKNQYNFWIGLSTSKKGLFYKWVDGSEVKSTLTCQLEYWGTTSVLAYNYKARLFGSLKPEFSV